MTTRILYAFPTAPGFFNLSPYAIKADIMLTMSGLAYETVTPEDHKVFPKGKLPVLKDGDQIIEDSEFIRLYLADKQGKTLDGTLTDADKAIGHAICRMLDARTSQAMIWSRWVDDAGWAQTKGIFFRDVPEEAAEEVRGVIRAGIESSDFGLHSLEEKKQLIASDLAAIATLLGDRDWFLSDDPTYLDATLFGFIANLYGSPIRTWTSELVAEQASLVAYFERGMQRWYPEGLRMLKGEAAE